ncbi:MAG: cytochrome C [Denitrovibrio sp.]|nr:MAG: cytochrome C [Denitrovibrio sp.]
MKFLLLLLIILPVVVSASTCITCHDGIKPPSENHDFACIQCHGGDNTSSDKNKSHQNMFGGKNPSDPTVWDKTCASCHENQHRRVNSSLMYTNTGMIKNTFYAWGNHEKVLASVKGAIVYGEDGKELKLEDIVDMQELPADLYRKLCGVCHISFSKMGGHDTAHSTGCATCHFRYDADLKYKGGDKVMQDKKPYSRTHEMLKVPDGKQCYACHNRSGRISLTYNGQADLETGLVPTRNGMPADVTSGLRNLTPIHADIHAKAGMECVDCHTSRDIMGDGYVYENLYRQIEISCADCHGDENSVPAYREISSESDSPLLESRSYKKRANFGDKAVLTKKKRMYSNVFVELGEVVLYTKKAGKRLVAKVIKDTPEHEVYGHDKLECYSCHSKSVPQCYGCHTNVDMGKKQIDPLKGKETQGFFSEKEDLRTLYTFPLAINERGKISPVTPGCQTFLSVSYNDQMVQPEGAPLYMGEKKLKFAPFYSHNTSKKAVTCSECHSNPYFAGLGQGIISTQNGLDITSAVVCENCDKSLDALSEMKDNDKNDMSAVVREGSRPLDIAELKRMFSANLCITCHEKGERRIYAEKINYTAVLNDRIHKPLLRK